MYFRSRAEIISLTTCATFLAEKYLEALKALRIAHALEPRNPELHFRIAQLKTEVECKFLHAFSIPPSTSLTQNRMTASGSLPQHVSAVINSAMPTLFPAPSIEAFNSDLLQHGSSLAINILAAAKALHIARGDSGRGEVEELVFQIVKGEVDPDVEVSFKHLFILVCEYVVHTALPSSDNDTGSFVPPVSTGIFLESRRIQGKSGGEVSAR